MIFQFTRSQFHSFHFCRPLLIFYTHEISNNMSSLPHKSIVENIIHNCLVTLFLHFIENKKFWVISIYCTYIHSISSSPIIKLIIIIRKNSKKIIYHMSLYLESFNHQIDVFLLLFYRIFYFQVFSLSIYKFCEYRILTLWIKFVNLSPLLILVI